MYQKLKLPPTVSKGMRNAKLSDIRMMAKQCAGGSCLLCGRRAYVVMLFTPPETKQILYGAAPGKYRQSLYALCKRCYKKRKERSTLKRIESVLFNAVQSMRMVG